jgi:two-component system, NtrC family, response regulator AtoC
MTDDGVKREATPRARLLLLEDDEMLSGLLARVLRTDGYSVDVLDTAADLPSPAKLQTYDVVLSDIHLGGGTNGMDVLKEVRKATHDLPVILMTAFADIEGAMNAVGLGAYDYLSKPIEPTDLRRMVGEAVARRKLADADAKSINPREAQAEAANIVGTAGAMLTVYKTVAQVAPTTATVLIVGESGTGKELVARAIHDKSPRTAKPFVAVNCAALPESILESELFGHERGSFTGATGMKRGLFEEANGGTLFLDEIGEISPKMQVQLLRVLQEGEIRRIGASETIKVDVRVVAATNRDLKIELQAGRFREDLFFRLQVVTVRVPPLRDRKSDVSLLVRHFLVRHGARLGRPVPRVAPEVMTELERYDFPGNVRELSHVVERAMLMAREGVITVADLPPEVTRASEPSSRQNDGAIVADWPTLSVLERRYIDRVLSRTGGNKTRAAEVLGVDRRTLNRLFARERAAASGALDEDAELAKLEAEDDET